MFLNPFRRRSDRTQQAAEQARQRAFELGEEALRTQREQDRMARQERAELDWRRQQDEEELRRELEAVEIPPRILSEEEAWAEGGSWLEVTSSNVAAIAYDAEDERLLIQYKDASIYFYSPVPMPMAIDFYRAGSKGRWVWRNLRVEGTVYGFRVPYGLLSGPSQRVLGVEARRWMKSEESRRKHGHIPPSGKYPSGETIKPRHINPP